MTFIPDDSNHTQRIEVRIYEDGELVHTSQFAELAAAEALAAEWAERVPGIVAEFEDLGRHHDLYEAVEQETAIVEDYPRPSDE